MDYTRYMEIKNRIFPDSGPRPWGAYALIMPARNEEKVIRHALDSIVNQTSRPKALIVALNDCTDGTAAVVAPYVAAYSWISMMRHDFEGKRNYGKKARIFAEAFSGLANLELGFIGNQDADVSVPPEYYREILDRFGRDSRLGIAGGTFYELRGKMEIPHFDTYAGSVCGMAQLFRLDCYRDIGGYRPASTGGVDMAADAVARYRGWRTRTFPEIRYRHHRPLGTAESNLFRAKYKEAVRDFHMGYGFLFHLLKCVRRIPERPFLVGSLIRLAAFCASYFGNSPMVLDKGERDFLRAEQRLRILSLIHSLLPHLYGFARPREENGGPLQSHGNLHA
jgi:glycosyltransferase involved in cell wall biosynthesis